MKKAYRSLRQESGEESATSSAGFLLMSKENVSEGDAADSFSRGSFSVEVRLEDGGENGGDGVGDGENMYLWFPGPVLIGRGEGGVGGVDDGEMEPSLSSFTRPSSSSIYSFALSSSPISSTFHFPGSFSSFESKV